MDEDAAEGAVEFLTERFVALKRAALLGRENRVQDDQGQRLRHGGRMAVRLRDSIHCADGSIVVAAWCESARRLPDDSTLTGLRRVVGAVPRVARSGQAWAG